MLVIMLVRRTMRRWVFCLAAQLLAMTSAHIIVFSDLQGLPLCIEPRTVQVAIVNEADKPLSTQPYQVKGALEETLKTTLRRYNIPYSNPDDCGEAETFVYVLYYVDIQEDNGDPYVVFSSLIQVGEMPEEVTASFMTNLPNGLHENYTAVMYYLDELGDDPIVTLQGTTQEMIEELANSWWEDYLFVQELRQRERLRRIRYASLGLTILVSGGVIATFMLRRRTKRRQEAGKLSS
jgi:hypothetical protein